MPNLNELFPNDKEKQQAIGSLRLLRNYPNWKFLVEKILQPDIEDLTKKILDPALTDREKEMDMKRRRFDWIVLSRLPETLIEALQAGESDIISFDPYFTKAEEIESE